MYLSVELNGVSMVCPAGAREHGARPAPGGGEEEERRGREEVAGRDVPPTASGGEGGEDEGQELLPGGEQHTHAHGLQLTITCHACGKHPVIYIRVLAAIRSPC